MRKWAVAVAVVVAACVLSFAGLCRADDVTLERFRDLARRAGTDANALAELLEVDHVDGRPVNPSLALESAEGAELRARLDVLAEPGSLSGPPPGGEAATAALILADARFQESAPPRPFAGVLEWIGEALDRVAGRLPGSEFTLFGLGGLAVVALAAIVASRLVRGRAGVERAVDAPTRIAPLDPRYLERQAAAAEGSGHFATAVRLRFQAGLIRLDQDGSVAVRPWSTTAQVSRSARSATFDQLAETFEDVAYGGKPATGEHAAQARADWPRALSEAKPR